MLRILFKFLIAFFLCASPALAQVNNGSLARPSGFFANPGSIGDANATFFTLTPSAGLENERVLNFNDAQFNTTDHGPGMNFDVNLETVSIGNGGTGGTTGEEARDNLLNFEGDATAGDIIYFDGTHWARLPVGTTNQVLSVSAGGLPEWSSSNAGAPADSKFILWDDSPGLTNERIAVGTAGNITIIESGGDGGPVTWDIGTNVVTLTGTQTLTNKTLTQPQITYHASEAVGLKGTGAFKGSLIWPDWSANRTLTIPDPGASASFVMSEGASTINGVKTFGSAPVLTTGTLTAGANLQTFPSSAQTLVGRTSTDTLTNKTLTSPIMGTQITLDQTTADYTLTWDNPAAGRAYSFRDVLGTADIAMTTDSAVYTAGGVAYGNGSKIDFTGAGTTGQYLKSNGASAPAFASLAASDVTDFGGDGSDGALVGGENITGGAKNYSSVLDNDVISGIFVYDYNTIINSTSTIVIDGHITINRITATGNGGVLSFDGGGIGGGKGAVNVPGTSDGGAGAASAVAQGGSGGGETTGSYTSGTLPHYNLYAFSGGGGGAGASGVSSNGKGSDGLPCLLMLARGAIDIQDDCQILATAGNGQSGGSADCGGGGGAAAPSVLAASQVSVTVHSAAVIALTGGGGGDGGTGGNSGGGGGGGGGCFVEYAPSVTDASTPNLVGGTGGVKNGTGNNGVAGNDGYVLTIIGKPTLPIISFLKDGGIEQVQLRIANGLPCDHKDIEKMANVYWNTVCKDKKKRKAA